MNFTSHLDAVVTVAVRLANALTPGEAHGRPYLLPEGDALPAAVTAALRAGRADTRPVPPGEAAGFPAVAASLRAVFEAVADGRTDAAAGLVNEMLARTGARPRLDRHDGEPWHLHFHGAEESLVTGWAAGCATGLAVRARHRPAGPPGRVHRAPVRPRLRRHLAQRDPPVLLDRVPEPGQGRGVPRRPPGRLGNQPKNSSASA